MTKERIEPEEYLTKKDVTITLSRPEKIHKSRAEKINNLFRKYKRWYKQYYETTDFKQPVMFLERRSGDVEFYEDVTVGTFDFMHSDGTQKFILLVPSRQKKFGFAERMFKGYYCHEDYPLPLPDEPTMTTEQVDLMLKSALSAKEQLTAKVLQARGVMWKNILIGIGIAGAVIIGGLILYGIVVPEPTLVIETPLNTVVPQNLNNIIANTSTTATTI